MELSNFPLYLIPLLPLSGALLLLVFGKRLGREGAGALGCLTVGVAALFAWRAFFLLLAGGPTAEIHASFFDADWIKATELVGAASVHIKAGLLLDRLSAVMILTITTIGFLIHVYSTAYMEHDEGIARYFGYLNLFTGAMLILVLGDSLVVTFVGWEGVGLCSYLLIGFWFTKEQNAYAGRKAFIVNRIGDFGFLLGMFMLFAVASTLNYGELHQKSEAITHAKFLTGLFHGRASYATVAGLLLFVGATGKSAQIPLYIWLPDAMAGPTPVSALIHAATMVTAGVYMIARLNFLFEGDAFLCALISFVGAATALFAATMGITQRPIKKILAYSTVSQLGFMFIGVGTRAYTSGVFHLMTHACFKAGLFLGAGSIMHALDNEEDVMKMGGLAKKLPITRWSFLIYCCAIAGLPPFSGFFSKDAILASAFEFEAAGLPHGFGVLIYAMGLVAAACTAFYMFRAYFLVFHGEFRGDPHLYEHAHESPPAMSWVLAALAVLSVAVGFIGVPEVFHAENLLELWFARSNFPPEVSSLSVGGEYALMAVAVGVSALGIGGAYALYGNGLSPAAGRIATAANGLYTLVSNKYYVDEIYDALVVKPLRQISFLLWRIVDVFIIDLVLVRGSATVVDLVGRSTRYLQNGDVQRGVVGVLVGTVAIFFVGANWTARHAAAFTTRVHGSHVEVNAQPVMMQRPERDALEYSYDFGEGAPITSHGIVAGHEFQTPGKHKIVVEVRDPRWKTTARESQTVTIRATANTEGAQP